MSAYVQSRNAGIPLSETSDSASAVTVVPGALSADPHLGAALARGRALQARAVREGFAAAFAASFGALFGGWGRLRYAGRRSTAS